MTRDALQKAWSAALRATEQKVGAYETLAEHVVELYASDEPFRRHLSNRSGRVTETTGQEFDPDNFDIYMARAFIADEISVASWDALLNGIEKGFPGGQPILFRYAVAALWRGDFTALDSTIGHDAFRTTVVEWYQKGYFVNEPETFAEAFAAACWLGHVEAVEFLLDQGVDPYAGMRTGLAGPHWAASSAKPAVIKLLVARDIPLEIENMYGGTVLGQALWSAINEYTPGHAEVIEILISGGAHVWPDTLEWWEQQPVPDDETGKRVSDALRRVREH